jgi:hypothetical protein
LSRNRQIARIVPGLCHPDALDIVNHKDAVARLDPDTGPMAQQ